MRATLFSFVPCATVLLIAAVGTASAQVLGSSEGPVVYGHHHLNVTSMAAHRAFWVDTMGATAVPFGDGELFKFPGVLVMARETEPGGGTKGTTVNHIGFSVPSVRAMVDRVKAAGYPIVTRAELPATSEVVDDLSYVANQDAYIAFAMAPDDVKVEFFENARQSEPIRLHHVHFAAADVDAMKAWYVETFGAAPGMRGSFEAADLPGVNLTFSPSAETPAATRGRSLDHIGFEVRDLEAFCRRLAARGIAFDRPYREIESLGIAIAFFTDPFGTYIELTEGLDAF